MSGYRDQLDDDGQVPGPAGYAGDFYRWALDQAELLRSGKLSEIDVLRIAEEIEDLGRSDYSALQSDLTIILQYMLKWDTQPGRRSRSWEASIREHRRRVSRRLRASQSLQSRLAEAVAEAYEDGRDRALAETNVTARVLPLPCSYSWADIMERPFSLNQE